MNTEIMIAELRAVAEKHKNDKLLTFQTDITAMCKDIIPKLEQLAEYEAVCTLDECQEARERRISVKPKGRYKTRYIWDGGYCPICECGITARWNFCQNRGQAIDWSKWVRLFGEKGGKQR